MVKLWLLMGLIVAPVMDATEFWWCKECGLAYPTSQKYCLNKECSLYKKPK